MYAWLPLKCNLIYAYVVVANSGYTNLPSINQQYTGLSSESRYYYQSSRMHGEFKMGCMPIMDPLASFSLFLLKYLKAKLCIKKY